MFYHSNSSYSCRFRQGLLLLFSFLLFLGHPLVADCYEIIIGTGEQGSFSHYTAKALCRIFERQDSALNCVLKTDADEVDDLTNVQGGSLDLALLDSHLLYESLTGQGSFAYLGISYDRLRAVAPLYDIPLTLVVRTDAGVLSSYQLPGKRVNTGPPGSPVKRFFELVMQANGWTEADFPVLSELSSSLSQDKIAFRDGRIQVLVHRNIHPDPGIRQLMNDGQAQLVGIHGPNISQMVSRTPSLSEQVLSSSYYSAVTEDIVTFGTTMTLVTSAELDDETARTIAAALIEQEKRLRILHPSLSSFRLGEQQLWFGSLKVHAAVLDQTGM